MLGAVILSLPYGWCKLLQQARDLLAGCLAMAVSSCLSEFILDVPRALLGVRLCCQCC